MDRTYRKNEKLTVTIEDMGTSGEGIGKVDGYTLFIKDAVIGDTVTCSIMKAKKNYAYAKLQQVVTPSPFRVTPACPAARQCGGCQIQELEYAKQLEHKYRTVRGCLIRIGGFTEEETDAVLHPVVGMESPYRYRNKAQVPVGMRAGKPQAGYYAAHSHFIVPVTDCVLGPKVNGKILESVLEYMRECRADAYDEETGKGLIRHVLIRTGYHSGQIMVCIIANAERLPKEQVLVEKLCRIEGMYGITLNTNTKRTNVILGDKLRTLWGEDAIEDTLVLQKVTQEEDGYRFADTEQEVRFRISPLSFYQVNPQQTQKLYSLALKYAGLTGKENVWDLYCGVGTISLFLAGSAGHVYGVEVIPEAIENARRNAAMNGIGNVTFRTGKAEEIIPAYVEEKRAEGIEKPVDVVVVDPPRKGCDERLLAAILKVQPERIVYVSCDPATLARDLRILADGGYRIREVTPVDQFAHTMHIESCVLLERVSD